MSDLTERLRRTRSDKKRVGRGNTAQIVSQSFPVNPDGPEAADALEAQEARISTLEAALAPFAQYVERDNQPGLHDSSNVLRRHDAQITYGDLRAASKSLTPSLPK